MTTISPPRVPWQVTGNHWLAVPCIHPADGSIHAIGVVNRSARASVEFAGSAEFLSGAGDPLIRPVCIVNGERVQFGTSGVAWERAFGWIPMFTASAGDLLIRATIFAPYGRDADVAGVVYAFVLENRADQELDVQLALEGTLGHRQQRVRSARVFDDAHRAMVSQDDAILLDGAALPSYAALAIATERDAQLNVDSGPAPRWSVTRAARVAAGNRAELAFFIAAGPERDGAEATAAVMRRRGWRELLRGTRAALQSFEQNTGNDALDRIVNRNLLFTYFYSVVRALDDAHFYIVRSRAPWNPYAMTVTEWEALSWVIAAVEIADAELGRELLLRVCELHGYAPGSGVRYLDGTLFQAGFALESAAAYAIAVERHIERSGDDGLLDEQPVAEALYASWEDVEARRDRHRPLYATEVMLSGKPAALPFTAHANAVAAHALEVLKRTLDEKTAARVEEAEAVRTELREQFAGGATLAAAVDLSGGESADDDPVSSLLWLPFHGATSRDDAVYRRTAESLAPRAPLHLAAQCARLVGPRGREVLEWLRRAPLDGGLAAELLDEDGRAVANGGDAALAGLLAWTILAAVHATSTQP